MADQTTVPAVRPEGRFAKRVFLVLAIASAAAFALAFLYALSMRSATGHWLPIEIRSPGLLSAVYTSMGFSPASFFLSAMIRVLLPRGKRWYQWVAFAVLQLALLAALVFAVGTVFDIARGRTYYEETQGTMIFGLPGPRADSRILYVARGRPRMKVAQQDDGRFRLIRDTSLPIRYSVRADINNLGGRWEVRDGAVHLATVTLRDGAIVEREKGADWVPSRGRITSISSEATLWDPGHAFFTYAPQNVVDGDLGTAWVDDGGHTLRIDLEASVTADAVTLSATGASLIGLEFETSDGYDSETFALRDGMPAQTLTFLGAHTFGSVSLSFPQSRSASIAEVQFLELGERVELEQPRGTAIVEGRYRLPAFSDMMVRLSSGDYREGQSGDDAGIYDLVLGSDGSVAGTVGFAEDALNAEALVQGGGWELDEARGEISLTVVYPYKTARPRGGAERENERQDYLTLKLVGPTQVRSIDNWYTSTSMGFDHVSRWPGSDLDARELLWDDREPFAVVRSMARYPQARLLSMRRTGIDVVPAELFALGLLETLDLGSNGMGELPAEVAKLRYLKRLSLSGNRLERLPAELAELKYLEELDLSGNRLTALPAGLERLSHLRSLGLGGNLFSEATKQGIERAFSGREVRIGF